MELHISKGNLGLLVAAIAAAFVIIEVGLRLIGVSYPYFTQTDPYTGFALRPHAAGWQRDEGMAFVRINSHGFRDKERTKIKTQGKIRIAVLGDSYVEARQVTQEKTFTAVMEQEMQSCRPTEVLNFGVSGFSTVQEFLLLQQRVWEFDPDIVLLAFTTGNDVKGNSKELSQGKDQPYMQKRGSELIPDFTFRDSDNYKSQNSASVRAIHAIVNRSRVAQVLNRARVRLRSSPTPIGTDRDQYGAEIGLDSEIYSPPLTPDWVTAWGVTTEVLNMMKRNSVAHDATFLMAVVSNGIQVHPDSSVRSSFAKQLQVRDLLYPNRRIVQIGEHLGIDTLSLVEPLLKYAEENEAYLHGFDENLGSGHWNEEGHRVAGELLAAFVCDKL